MDTEAQARFGVWLADAMRARGLTAQQVVVAADGAFTAAAMSDWRSGKKRPRPEKLRSLAAVLRVPYAEVMAAAGYLVSSPPPASVDRVDPALAMVVGGLSPEVQRRLAEVLPAFLALGSYAAAGVPVTQPIDLDDEGNLNSAALTPEGVSRDGKRKGAIERGVEAPGGYAAEAIRAIGTARRAAQGEDGGPDGD